MKTVIMCLALISLAVGQKPAVQKNPQVLYDFRVEDKSVQSNLAPVIQKAVLPKVFRKYLTNANRCNPKFDAGGTSDYLAAARNAGQIVPSIIAAETGSFTAPGKTEIIFLIDVSECNASHADNFGTKRAAIFTGQKLIADVDAEFAKSIVRKTDLNGDGVDELLMTTGDVAQGTLIQMATLVSFQNGKRNLIQDFGTVVEDSCASGFPGSESSASVIYISDGVPGAMPKLAQENYSSSCGKTKRWRLVSRGKKE